MPELPVKEGRLPELRLPEISRDEIIRSFSEIKRPDLDLPNVEWPKVDLSRIEWTREDLDKAVVGITAAARLVRPAVRSRASRPRRPRGPPPGRGGQGRPRPARGRCRRRRRPRRPIGRRHPDRAGCVQRRDRTGRGARDRQGGLRGPRLVRTLRRWFGRSPGGRSTSGPWVIVRRILGNRDLRRIFGAFLLFNMAEFGTWVAVLLYAYDRTGPASVGVVALLQLVPAALAAPPAAALSQRR